MKSKREAVLFLIIAVVAGGLVAAVLLPPWLETRSRERAMREQVVKLQKGMAAILVKGGQVRGNPKAPYTLVMVSDFQCGTCAASAPRVAALVKKHGERMKVLFRAIQINDHYRYSFVMAHAALAAGKQGKYWEMHDRIYEQQQDLVGSEDETVCRTKLREIAVGLGLDGGKFAADLVSKAVAEEQARDEQFSEKAGVEKTPTYFFVTPSDNVAKVGTTPELERFLDKPENWR